MSARMGWKRKQWLWLGTNLCRLLIAVTFAFSGVVKLIDPRGTQYKIEDYAVLAGLNDMVPPKVALVMAVILAMLETYIGLNMFFGIRRRTTSRTALAFMLVMTPLTLLLALYGGSIDCGCFGEAVHLTPWQTFGKNIVLLPAALITVRSYRRMTRLITERNQWILSLYSLVFAFMLAMYNIHYLPVMDFRPYSIGTDLPREIEAEWENPSPAMKYADFAIMTTEGEDVTVEWLEQKGYKILLIAPYLEEADDSQTDNINAIYDYCHAQGYPFLCLTSSMEASIERWRDLTGAEYPFALTDGTTLKTVIRANPGLMLLHDGTIYAKWSNNDLPDSKQLTVPLEELKEGQPQVKNRLKVIYKMILWFLIPLLGCTLLDRIWIGKKFYERHKIHKKINLKQKENEKKDCSR